MTTLTPCPNCERHVRPGTCPFCGALASEGEARASRRVPRSSLTRAAVFAGATALATVGCGSPQEDDSAVAPAYGLPPDDGTGVEGADPDDTSGGEDSDPDDALPDTVAPPYGAPPAQPLL